MNKTAGIIYPIVRANFINEIKQCFLYFDLIGFPNLYQHMKMLKDAKNQHYSSIVNELEFLIDQKFLFDGFSRVINSRPKLGIDMNKLEDEIKFLQATITGTEDLEIAGDVNSRICSLLLNNKAEQDEFQSIPLIRKLRLPNELNASKIDVVNCVIKQIPIPDDRTPWEAIVDFKANPDNKGKFAALRKWVNKTVKSDISAAEVEDELEDLVYKYRKSLERHKIKYHLGIIQSVIVGSTEILENIIKFKWSDVAKKLFSVNAVKAELLNLELTAPGNELAYIYHTQQKFSK